MSKDTAQHKRFKDTARNLECDESGESFERALRTVAQQPKAKTAVHASDCALHNAPAFEPGACDCGGARDER